MFRSSGQERCPSPAEVTAAAVLAMVTALSPAGCIHFTYDDTTPLPASLSTNSTPTTLSQQPPGVTPTIPPATVCSTPSPTLTPVVSAAEPTPSAPTPATAPELGARYHLVQPGETLYSIGFRYRMTVEDIAAANNLLDPSSLQVGQRLLIPSVTEGTQTYLVQPGDTLYSIAQRFNTSVVALAALNDIAPPYTIQVGQTLTLPK